MTGFGTTTITQKPRLIITAPKHTVVIKLTENKNIYVTGGEKRKL